MTRQICCKINWNYLPIKAHYFFLYGGCGAMMPFMQVVAKELGISSMAVGIIFTLIPVIVFISSPMFGFITDKVQKIGNILILLLIVTGVTFSAVLFVPPVKNKEIRILNTTADCQKLKDGLLLSFSKYKHESSYDKELTNKQYDCKLKSHHCLKNTTLNGSLNITSSILNHSTRITAFFLKLHGKKISTQECDCMEKKLSTLICELDFYEFNSFSTKYSSEYKTYNFWIFLFLAVISGTGSLTLLYLTDAACNEILGHNSNQYGKQRLWGTVSWGIASFVAGIFNDLATGQSKNIDYSPGFYLMMAFFAIDILILSFFRVKKTHTSISICKDVSKIFSSVKTVIFALGVFICGALSGLLWTYQFWFLTDLESTPLLLGLNSGIQSLVAEVPFLFFSGWFVNKFGHFNCLIAAVAAFSLRLGLYSILHNPWWVLPIDLLHGVTFAIFFTAMTLYAADYALPGTEATMIGVFGGIFEGLGVAAGSFLGGLGYDTKGGRWTFFVGSMISLACVPILIISNMILSRYENMPSIGIDRTVFKGKKIKCTSQESIHSSTL